jgi:hypothetical protein
MEQMPEAFVALQERLLGKLQDKSSYVSSMNQL